MTTTEKKADDIWSGKLKIRKHEDRYQVWIPEYKLTLDITRSKQKEIHIVGWRSGRLIFSYTRFQP